MGNSYFFHKLVIDYGYWLDILTSSLEFSVHRQILFCFPKLRFILLHNIVDKDGFLLLVATHTATKSIETPNVHNLPFSLEIKQCKQF